MAGDGNDDKPDPIDDLKKGVGLLFRAAKTAVEKLPASKLEHAVVTGVKEVGRAIENVTDQLDREIFGGTGTVARPPASQEPPADQTQARAGEHAPTETAPAEEPKPDPEAHKPQAAKAKEEDADKGGDDAPKGPRVA